MSEVKELAALIEDAFEKRTSINPKNADDKLKEAISDVIDRLDSGRVRVAEKVDGQWKVNEWVKKAVLLSFRVQDNYVMPGGYTSYFDKVPSKFENFTESDFQKGGYRIVPPAAVRKGSYLAPDVIAMPSFVNIGAYVDSGTMIDAWATVGSCAQIGKNVHLSGGAGIGGVLEPLQASPTIIEDNCFIGARSEIVEGVVIEEGAVISMGVFIGQSTRIYDRETGEITYGRVPKGAVVVPGSIPTGDGKCSLYCAVIVKKVDAQTRAKVGLNELLRTP